MAYEAGDEVLLELGRFTWDAMHLEDAVIQLSMVITMNLEPGLLVSQYVERARAELDRWPTSEARAEVLAWLNDAMTALDEERNEVLHARPEVLFDPRSGEWSRALGVTPRRATKKRAARGYQRRPLEVEHLRAARHRMALLDMRFADIDVAVWAAHPSQSGCVEGSPYPLPNPSGNPSNGRA
ncbi:hypothetical protein F9C11_20490 [Amycolatopsis sp. VS8301801F10]|uniref:hypothetical protein n=1 Tax=unclassified Amycolatopsis TaxID=2618356 RepID=UPI0038FCBF64